MRLVHPLVLCLALAGGALGLRTLAAAREDARDARRLEALEVRPLVAPGETEWIGADGVPQPVAAVGVQRGRGKSFTYARSGGLWRCLEHHGAVASEARIVGLMEARASASRLVAAEGSDPAAYGLGAADRTLLTLHGPGLLSEPDRDIVVALELGASIPGAAGCYARFTGSAEILELDFDLTDLLADPPLPDGSPRPLPRGEVPPLLERLLVPSGWPGTRSVLERVRVARDDGTGFSIEMTDPGQVGPKGEPPVPRFLLREEGEVGPGTETHPVLGTGYTLFLFRAPAVEVVDPRTVDPAAVNAPLAVVTLEARDAPPLELRVISGGFGADPLVVDAFSGSVYRVSQRVADLVAPDGIRLIDTSLGNPWDAFLR